MNGGSGAFWLPANFKTTASRKPAAKRSHPEQSLQTHVAGLLSWLLPDEVAWTAIGHGGGGKMRGAILKGMGLKAGWPDILILYQKRAHFVELKARTGTLSPEQRAVHRSIVLAGSTVATCKSVEEVKMILEVWGIPMRTMKPSAQAIAERMA